MSHSASLYVLIAALVLLATLAIAPLRVAVSGIFSAVLTPSVVEIVKTVVLWLYWLLKRVLWAHFSVIRHLTTPRRVLFPRLDDDDVRKL